MELREFVKDSLVQIVEGALAAHEVISETGAGVNPERLGPRDNTYSMNHGKIDSVEFDVAITESDSSGSKGGLGVFLGSVGIGGQVEKSTEATALSRIRFRIPIGIPTSRGRG